MKRWLIIFGVLFLINLSVTGYTVYQVYNLPNESDEILVYPDWVENEREPCEKCACVLCRCYIAY
jgi:hypothetical protein